MSFWAYMLRCADGTYDTGHTEDLERRLWEHQSGVMKGYTSTRLPVDLVWAEEFSERADAKAAEVRIKDWSRVKKEALIAGDETRRLKFSRPPGERGKSLADARPSPSLRSGKRVLSEDGKEENPHSRAQRAASSSAARSSTPIPPPILILVRPQLGENIGKAARAMLNFGLTELRLVAPRDGWPNPSAGPAASGADSVLADAQVYATVADATADCAHVYATTVRKRGVIKPVVTPEGAAAEMRTLPGRSAILFGPERTGLETDDVAVARTIITVPINPAFGSLNLAQAVMVVAYEWSKAQNLAQPPKVDDEPPAPQAELDGLIGQLDAMLDYAGFYFPPDKVPTVKRTIRSILTKPGWNAQEVRTLRGVLTAIEKPRPKT